jgi:2-hydroxy-6-oxonona-2,4-dienedioate hydrolase
MSIDKGTTYRSIWSHLADLPFRQDYITVNGLRTRFMEAGDRSKPALVLIHGSGGHWETYCGNIPALAQHYRVFALDMMGCGFTDKPDFPYQIKDYADHIAAFIDAMELPRVSLIGVSLGSWVAARLALDRPGRVRSMVFVAPTGHLPMPPEAQRAVLVRQQTADTPTWENAQAVLNRLVYDPATMIDDIVMIRQRVYSMPGMSKIMPHLMGHFDPETRKRNSLTVDELRSLDMPILLIENVDKDDPYLETARTIVHILPKATMAPMRRVAHWGHFEDPAEFNRLALDFLAQAESR